MLGFTQPHQVSSSLATDRGKAQTSMVNAFVWLPVQLAPSLMHMLTAVVGCSDAGSVVESGYRCDLTCRHRCEVFGVPRSSHSALDPPRVTTFSVLQQVLVVSFQIAVSLTNGSSRSSPQKAHSHCKGPDSYQHSFRLHVYATA